MTIATTPGYDATGQNVAHLPAGQAAGYVTGSGAVPWTAADWAAHPGAVRIDQSPVLTAIDETADALDYENSAATLADLAPWCKAAAANYHAGARPGQRSPAIYASRDSLTAVANALDGGGVTSGIGLWVADWSGTEAEAAAEVAGASGPFPVIGRQWQNNVVFDSNVFSVPWLTTVSKAPAPVTTRGIVVYQGTGGLTAIAVSSGDLTTWIRA